MMGLRLGLGLSRRGGPAGPSYGPELVINGDGAATTSWTADSGAVHTIVGGRHRVAVDGAGTAGALIRQAINLDTGATYRFRATLYAQVAGYARISSTGSTTTLTVVNANGPTFMDQTFTAGAFIEIYLAVTNGGAWGAANSYAEFDDISIMKVL